MARKTLSGILTARALELDRTWLADLRLNLLGAAVESLNGLRAERDRFLAFAFAAADALIEIARDGTVRFAAGATRSLFGATPDKMLGSSIFDLVPAASQSALHAALATADRQGRFSPTEIKAGASGRSLRVSGSRVPQMPGSVFLAFGVSHDEQAEAAATAPPNGDAGEASEAGAASGNGASPAPADDPENQLLDASSFDLLASQSFSAPGRRDRPYRLSLLATTGLGEVESRLEKKGLGRELSSRIARLLKKRSVEGRATRLGDDRYAFISEGEVPVRELRAEITDLVRETAPEEVDRIDISGASFQLIAHPGVEKDAMRALRYTLNKFAEGKGDITTGEFSAQSPILLNDTIARIHTVRSIITRHRFRLAYQPIFGLGDGTLHHFEALMRLADQTSPHSTVVFAEGTGLSAELDLAVSKEVLAALSRAKLKGTEFSVAINVSGSSLMSEGFVAQMMDILRSYYLSPGAILLEVTESARIGNLPAARKAIAGFRSAGYAVCLDDFGAGSSDLQYLQQLPVDFVKIDGSYVREILTQPRHVAFVKAVIQLCRDLGVRTIAEMIETKPTAQLLTQLGVDYGQGYLFGKPEIGLPAK